VILILIGGIIGSIWGFEAFINIPEGESVNSVFLKKSGLPKNLGFQIHCDRFLIEFYENGTPKLFRSDIRLLSGKTVLKTGDLRVNHPMTFRGISFYQASYGKIPGGAAGLRIINNTKGEKDIQIKTKIDESNPLPQDEGVFKVVRVEENLRGMMGPAVLLSLEPKDGKKVQFWIFQNIEKLKKRFPKEMFQSSKLNPSAFRPYTFVLESLETKYFTGLQVNKDPGVPLIWIGFFMIIVGLFMTFFIFPRNIWIRLERTQKGHVISVAGRTNKNQIGLERELTALAGKLRDYFQAGG
jgi:cytochrome c biogenesis protein